MSKKQYCFQITPKNVPFDSNALKLYIKNLYIAKGVSDSSFLVIFVPSEDSTCIVLKTSGKEKIKLIENINKGLTGKTLKWRNITLGKPTEFIEGAQTWFDDNKVEKKGQKWTSIVQKGPNFPHITKPYKLEGGKLMYNGTMYILNSKEEQAAMFYAKRLVSEEDGNVVDKLTKDQVFNTNFWKDFKKILSPSHKSIFKSFNKLGWKNLKDIVKQQKSVTLTEEEKELKKVDSIETSRYYGYSYLDGNREQVGNFNVEPVGLFMGRGKNPLRGRIKKEVDPEDVIINVGKYDKVPTPPIGHTWGGIVHDHTSVWLAKWKDSVTGNTKYIRFAATGKFKGQSDLGKYENARKLHTNIELVRDKYMSYAKSSNNEYMQLGTVIWLIDNHGIRPGDERSKDQADTVGASTLRVEHIKLLSENKIKLHFLGKDSIEFKKDFAVPKLIYDNFKKLISGKRKCQQIFDKISASSINDYLQTIDENFSSKFFRTRLGSSVMFEALTNVKIPKYATKKQIKILFDKANIKVAKILNHTRSITTKACESLNKLKDQLKDLKLKLNEDSKIQKKIEKVRESINCKSQGLDVAMTTSLTNYIDPRIVVSWAEKQGKGRGTDMTMQIIKSIYSTAMLKKFDWAIKSTPKNWSWLTSRLNGTTELIPKAKSEAKSEAKSDKDNMIILKLCKSNFTNVKVTLGLEKNVLPTGGYIYPALELWHPFTLLMVKKGIGNITFAKKFNKLYDIFNKV